MKPVVLVSGASSEMGAACARHLSDSGCDVFSFARKGVGPAGGCAASSGEDPAFNAWLEDLLQGQDSPCEEERLAQFVVEKVWNRKGRIDAVVNCLDYGLAGPIEETTVKEAQALFEANVFDMVRICRTVLPLMREGRSGLMVNVGLSPEAVPEAFGGVYAASRQAMEALSSTLAREVEPFGVDVALIQTDYCAAAGDMPVARQARRETSAYEASRARRRSREAGGCPDAATRRVALLIEERVREAAAEPSETTPPETEPPETELCGTESPSAASGPAASRMPAPMGRSGISERRLGASPGALPLDRRSSPPLASFAGTWNRQDKQDVEEAILAFELSRLQRGAAGPSRWTCTGRSLPKEAIYVAHRSGDSAPFTARSGPELARLILDERPTRDPGVRERGVAASVATGANHFEQS